MRNFIRFMLLQKAYQLAMLNGRLTSWLMMRANRLFTQHRDATETRPATQADIDAALVARFIRPDAESDTGQAPETPMHWYVVTFDGVIDWYLGHTTEDDAYNLAEGKRLDG